VHRWLQRIADDALTDWDAARVESLRDAFKHELMSRNVVAGDLEAATARVVAALKEAVTDERGRWLLGPQRDARNEFRVTALINGEIMDLVIDRMFRDANGTSWIVDYKTSAHEGGDSAVFLDRERERYRAQLERYAAALGGTTAAMLGLYFPLLAGWREWRGK
jgi:ATP-dependent helicase/nuclease subunit A